jgi:hypothetical protein
MIPVKKGLDLEGAVWKSAGQEINNFIQVKN